MILPETPVGYTRESGYPKFTRTEGSNTITDKFYIAFDDFTAEAMDLLEQLYFGDLVINDIAAEPDAAQHKMFITLKYGQPGSSGLPNASDGQTEWTLDDGGQEIPIDKKKKGDGDTITPYFEKYLTKHNYKFAAANAEAAGSGEVDTIWNSTTRTTTELSNPLYRWVKEDDSLPEGWIVVKDKIKNMESVLCPSPIVVAITKFSSYDSAVGKRQKVGIRVTPKKTFGITGEWLVVGSNIQKDGRKWVVTTRYQNAEQWDSDYYKDS